jgi:hypothetical protein
MSSMKPVKRPPAQVDYDCHPMDHTGRRILAYLASVEPLDAGAVLPEYHKGRSVIEHMALSARGAGDPILTLSVEDCADVLYFVQLSMPIEPKGWWDDPKGTPSQIVGFTMVIGAVEKALRGRRS